MVERKKERRWPAWLSCGLVFGLGRLCVLTCWIALCLRLASALRSFLRTITWPQDGYG